MTTYFAIPTLAGQAAIAAAVAGTAPLTISTLVVGDGAGVPTTPLQTQTALVNQTGSVAVQSVARSPSTPTQVTVTAILDETIGGFTIRECGLLDASGNLLFVANVPDTAKQAISQGVDDVLTLGLTVVISASANITLVVAGTTYATHDYVNTQISLLETNIDTPVRPYFLAVISASTINPPASPNAGDTYLAPASGATGAWAGHANQIAQWIPVAENGAPAQWIFCAPPLQSMVGVADVGLYYELTASGWRSIFATLAEHLAGASAALFTNPAGVAAMIGQALSNALPLFGVLWCGVSGGVANIQTLTPATAITAYVPGQGFSFQAGFTNSAALQINISGVGLIAVRKDGPTGPVPLAGGEVVAGEIYTVRVDTGGFLQLTSTELGTAALKNQGASVNDPGTGALEQSEPVSAQTGANYAYVAADRGYLKLRSNGGVAMADTLPSAGAVGNGWFVSIRNADASASQTIAAPAGTSLNSVAAGAITLTPGQSCSIDCDASGNYWLVVSPVPAAVAAQFVYVNVSAALAPGVYEVDTSAGPVTITLEAAPSLGDNYTFYDPQGSWANNAVTLVPNGKTINGAAANFILDVAGTDPVTLNYKSGNWSLQ